MKWLNIAGLILFIFVTSTWFAVLLFQGGWPADGVLAFNTAYSFAVLWLKRDLIEAVWK